MKELEVIYSTHPTFLSRWKVTPIGRLLWKVTPSNPVTIIFYNLSNILTCHVIEISPAKTGEYPRLLYGKVNLSVLTGSFLVWILPYGLFLSDRFHRNGLSRVFFCFKSRQIYLQLKVAQNSFQQFPTRRF